MKKREKMILNVIMALLVVSLIVGIVMMVIGSNEDKDKQNETQNETTQNIDNDETNEVVEEFVSVLEDGTKYNISEKIKENKTVEGMETLTVENTQITCKDLQTVILADVTNTSATDTDVLPVKIILYDKDGNTIDEFETVISPAKANDGKVQLNAAVIADYANVYDYKIVKV